MESTIDVSCVICGESGLVMLAHTEEIAYFGEHTQVTLTCPACGWRQTDFIPAEAREGSCQSYHIDSSDDLQVRVIRGSACTVRLVELDLEVRPGSHSEENQDAIAELTKLTEAMLEIREGQRGATIEFLDPHGHSMILTDNVESRPLSIEEIEDLPVGPAAGLMEAGAAQSRAGPVTEE